MSTTVRDIQLARAALPGKNNARAALERIIAERDAAVEKYYFEKSRADAIADARDRALSERDNALAEVALYDGIAAERDAARDEASEAISRSFAVRAELERLQGLLNRTDTDYSMLDEKYDTLIASVEEWKLRFTRQADHNSELEAELRSANVVIVAAWKQHEAHDGNMACPVCAALAAHLEKYGPKEGGER